MNKETEEELKKLLILSIKELGEIAECIVKKDRPDHWKNELGDLCGLSIRPMLRLAGMEFNYACEIGIMRKLKKLHELKSESGHRKCPECGSDNTMNQGFGYSRYGTLSIKCHDCDKIIDTYELSDKHVRTVLIDKLEMYVCPKCEKSSFEKFTELEIHFEQCGKEE